MGSEIKFLEGKHVYLRPFEEDDIDYFFDNALWDREIRKLTGTQTVFSRISVQKFIERVAMDDSRIDLIISTRETNELIGDLALTEIDHINRNAQIRVGIFQKEYRGKGYGTDALSLILEYAFDILHLHRIGLSVYPFNPRGIKSYEKLGFKQEGIIRDELFYNGEYHDSIIMGVLKNEFHKRH
ncbi:GNAT family N-acetyltransferase [Salirhabdus salicampi]|uniref:GNAT family N-acetyltransferase n=1 Tax=Salirhabdus salicampi TaxID=476102 RepID=UPI0020C32870|nr:GNAT family protein [Salirhabdus salicampi]MCP8615404.1 GNAT family N-acetyltransferase [Salirhabdus salicampi]